VPGEIGPRHVVSFQHVDTSFTCEREDVPQPSVRARDIGKPRSPYILIEQQTLGPLKDAVLHHLQYQSRLRLAH